MFFIGVPVLYYDDFRRMVLNYIWIFFFGVAFLVALYRLLLEGDTEVFGAMIKATFDMSKTGFEISLGLTGVLTLWMGIMKIGERGGAVGVMSRVISPFFRRLFRDYRKIALLMARL